VNDTTLDTTGSKPAVRLERYLHEPPSEVWQAITDRARLREWFPCDVIVEGGRWEVGVPITFPFPPEVIDMTLTGTMLAVDQPKLLSYTWGEDETLMFELYPEGDGTRLVLTDQLRGNWVARNAAGWDDCLDRLAGLPHDPEAWRRRFAAYSVAFEPILGPQEGPPAGYQGDAKD
jgi:uncharacterized protein YndB with AHSA1/START domain